MGKHKSLDGVNRNILRVLSLYENSDTLRPRSELGENDLTREGLTKRLEPLIAQGFVKQIMEADGAMGWALKRAQVDDDRTHLQAG